MLNESQQVAVCHGPGTAMVLAGPGSGKTTVITHRVKHLIEQEKVPPEQIMVVTFTKAAAGHMQERFQALVGKTYPVTFGTFHSIYYKIVRSAHPYPGDAILSERQKYEILKEIVMRLRMDVASMQEFVQNIAAEISKLKNEQSAMEDYPATTCAPEDFKRIFTAYQGELQAEGKLDFDDILLQCYDLLQQNAAVRQTWQQKFSYILIDEFQDICRVQYETVKLLAAPENNLFIVGDDDQSIYGFRGACPEIMFQFAKDYPEAKKILLETNYRSVPEIVALSQNLIRHNPVRFDKHICPAEGGEKEQRCAKQGAGSEKAQMHAENGESNAHPAMPMRKNAEAMQAVDIRQFQNQREELQFVCKQIQDYRARGISEQQMAILVRNNSQIAPIREFLQNHRIPIGERGRSRTVYDSMVAKDVMAYIRGACRMEDVPLGENNDLMYIFNKPARLVSRQILAEPGIDFAKLKRYYAHNTEIFQNIEALEFHLNMIRSLTPSAAMTYICHGTGYEEYLRSYALEKQVKLQDLLMQLEQMQRESAKFSSLEEWLQYARTQEAGATQKQGGAGVQILTMHGAKGLEFAVVFVVDANQGVIPSAKTVRTQEYAQERRLFYVAVTRAIDHLHIYGVRERLGCKIEMSMFVEECMGIKLS